MKVDKMLWPDGQWVTVRLATKKDIKKLKARRIL